MFIKKEVLVYFIVLFILSTGVYAVCSPLTQQCGCGGTQIRHTLPDGSCSSWEPCSVTETEQVCNDQTDDDCDGLTDCQDSDCQFYFQCLDNDNDGYIAKNDCNDNNADINPGKAEVCNGIDDNCNQFIDENLQRECGTDIGICQKGTETCIGGTWQGCTAVNPATEICDGLDNNCNNQIDEGCPDEPEQQPEEPPAEQQPPVEEPATPPAEQPTEEPPAEPTTPLTTPQAQPSQPGCIDRDGDTYGSGCSKGSDCNDQDPEIYPGAPERCNNLDDNCNQQIDENLERACGIGVGICALGTEVCTNGFWQVCDAPDPQTEICYNDLDDDCDGQTDEQCRILSDEENRLKELLNRDYPGYSINNALFNYQQTKRFINLKKSSKIIDGKTEVTIELIPIQTLHNVSIYESIPKEFAQSTDNIRFNTQPKILEKDPLIVWHFAEVSDKVDLSYELESEIEDAHEKTETITYAESYSKKSKSIGMILTPLIAIPIVVVVLIFFARFARRK